MCVFSVLPIDIVLLPPLPSGQFHPDMLKLIVTGVDSASSPIEEGFNLQLDWG